MELIPDFSRMLTVGLLLLIPFFLIYKKAGLNPYWSLLSFVPLGLLVMFVHLAFIEWPNAQEQQETS